MYPGHRNIGGGGVPWREAVSYLFPFSTFDGRFETVIGQNICEVGTGAIALLLLLACFLDYRNIPASWRLAERTQRWQAGVLTMGLLAMAAWMVLPVPPWAGAILLWNNVQPERMEYAFGLLLALASGLLAQRVGVVFGWWRVATYVVLVACGWLALKFDLAQPARTRNANDLLVLVAAVPGFIAWRQGRVRGLTALFAASAVAGLLAMGLFNPLQSSRPIFAEHDSPVLRNLQEQQSNNSGILVSGAFPGAVQNGLGFRALTHVTAVPALDFWRKNFSDIPQVEFMEIFNRYSHITLVDGKSPRLIGPDNVGVPAEHFLPGQVLLPRRRPDVARPVSVWLMPGARIVGAFTSPMEGPLRSFGPSIGSGQNSADGILVVEACSQARCVSISRGVGDSQDNTYFEMPMPGAFNLAAGERVKYSIRLDRATKPLAFWAYALVPGETSDDLMRIDGVPDQSWTPRMKLGFGKRTGS